MTPPSETCTDIELLDWVEANPGIPISIVLRERVYALAGQKIRAKNKDNTVLHAKSFVAQARKRITSAVTAKLTS